MSRFFALLLLLPALALGSVEIKGAGSSNVAKVNALGSLAVNEASSTRPTYIAVATGLVTTALFNLTVEAHAASGFKVSQICVGVSNATAAALVTVTVNRRTTASSGGTVVNNDAAVATESVSRMDQADATWSGVARRTATLGTIGALLDGWGFTVGEIAAGTADPPGPAQFCKQYGINGEKLPTIPAGATNGLSVNVSAPGAGGLAAGSISITFIAE